MNWIKKPVACKQALRMGYSEICFRIARERGEPAMVHVRFEYLRSVSDWPIGKLPIGQFDLTHVK